MKKWLVVLSACALGACLEEPDASLEDNSLEDNSFDSSPSAAYQSCDECHVDMPPPNAPHNGTHSFFSCNDVKCHGNLVNEDGSMASINIATHNNNKMDATCLNCHDQGTVTPDANKDLNFKCTACHESPPSDPPHNALHATFKCNDPNCHGNMVNEIGTEILDNSKHMDEATEAACATCHGSNAGCTACHQTPPSGAPHTDGNHIMFTCNSPDCHGSMVNEDGTKILDATKHKDNASEIIDLSCGAVSVCHGV